MARMLLTLAPMLLASAAMAAEPLLARSYAAGLSDPRTVAAVIRPLLSPAGQVVEDPASNRVVVIDTEPTHRRVAAAMAAITVDARNVRITVTSELDKEARSRGVEASAGGRIGDVRAGAGRRPPERGVRIDGSDTRTTRRMTTQQTIVTLSGTKASITVAEQVPYSDWFWTWGLGQGLWTQATRWREVGTRMTVEPLALGNGQVRVKLTPSFEYFTDRGRQVTEVVALATEVLVPEGGEIELGGVPMRDTEFKERFLFGFGSSGEAERLVIRLRVEVQ